MTEEMIPAWVDGHLTPVAKLAVHQRGLRHKAVSVFVLAGDSVLIQRRALTKYHTPGLWANTCCTHPRWEEASADCAHRRLSEELGISGLDLAFAGHVTYRADVGGGLTEHEEVDIFTARVTRDLYVTPDPGEVAEVRWVHLDTLTDEVAYMPSAFTPWLRIYLADHAAQIFGQTLLAAR